MIPGARGLEGGGLFPTVIPWNTVTVGFAPLLGPSGSIAASARAAIHPSVRRDWRTPSAPDRDRVHHMHLFSWTHDTDILDRNRDPLDPPLWGLGPHSAAARRHLRLLLRRQPHGRCAPLPFRAPGGRTPRRTD